MNNRSTVVSYALAALAGVFFVAGISLLTDEGSDMSYGTREENRSNA